MAIGHQQITNHIGYHSLKKKTLPTSQKVLLDSIYLEIGQWVEEPGELSLLKARENHVSRRERPMIPNASVKSNKSQKQTMN